MSWRPRSLIAALTAIAAAPLTAAFTNLPSPDRLRYGAVWSGKPRPCEKRAPRTTKARSALNHPATAIQRARLERAEQKRLRRRARNLEHAR